VYRRSPVPGHKSLTEELSDLWEVVRGMRSSMTNSVLPDGFTWQLDSNGRVTVIDENGNVVLGGVTP